MGICFLCFVCRPLSCTKSYITNHIIVMSMTRLLTTLVLLLMTMMPRQTQEQGKLSESRYIVTLIKVTSALMTAVTVCTTGVLQQVVWCRCEEMLARCGFINTCQFVRCGSEWGQCSWSCEKFYCELLLTPIQAGVSNIPCAVWMYSK